MLSELDRKILKAIMEADRPVSNRELSLHCGAAINTIRKEIGLINEETKSHGVVIASRTSVGKYLELLNPRAAGPYLDYVAIHGYWDPLFHVNNPAPYLECMMKTEAPELDIRRTIDIRHY